MTNLQRNKNESFIKTDLGIESNEELISFIDEEIEKFIKVSGKEASINLVNNILSHLPEKNHVDVKSYIKKGILRYMKKFNPNVEDNVLYFEHIISDTLKELPLDDFINKAWKYVPYVLKKADYYKILIAKKNPIFIKNYDYSTPIFKFKNNVILHSQFKRKNPNIAFTDINYYLDDNESILYSKVVKEKFIPRTMKEVKTQKERLGENEKDLVIFDEKAYTRDLSISMYVFLQAQPKKAYTFFRYDSSSYSHDNLYFLNDKRREIFGEKALNPHFHFQNEDDALLCSKTIIGKNHKRLFKTGRCNAIDIPHLKKYLIELDKKSEGEIIHLWEENENYGMPFLEFKAKHIPLKIKLTTILEDFIEKMEVDDKNYINQVVAEYKTDKNLNVKTKFYNLISILDFIQYIYDTARSKSSKNINNLKRKEILYKLEIAVANEVFDAICQNSQKILQKNYKPLYEIDAKYLKQDEEESF